ALSCNFKWIQRSMHGAPEIRPQLQSITLSGPLIRVWREFTSFDVVSRKRHKAFALLLRSLPPLPVVRSGRHANEPLSAPPSLGAYTPLSISGGLSPPESPTTRLFAPNWQNLAAARLRPAEVSER